MGRISKIKRELIEEANKRLLGEQRSTHGIGTPPCMTIHATKCAGAFGPAIGTQFSSQCSLIDGATPTQSHVGQQVRLSIAPAGHPNTSVLTIDTVSSAPATTVQVAEYSTQGATCPTTGGECMELMVTKCAGAFGQPIGTQSHYPCATIDGATPTQADVGSVIRNANAPGGHPNTSVHTIDIVSPTTQAPNYPVFDVTTQNANCTTTHEDPCNEFRDWDRMEQRAFCERCRRAPDEPMCECCTDR